MTKYPLSGRFRPMKLPRLYRASYPKPVDDIRLFLPAVAAELTALNETRCPHDRQRALKAIGHLEILMSDLKAHIEALPANDQRPPLVIDNERQR